MPAFLPIILASTHLVLAADHVPQFNIEPTCSAVHEATTGLKRDEAGCKRDENAARDKLRQTWGHFSDAQQTHCARLSTLGGFPSYVELLTCLEISKAAKNLPPNEKSNTEATGRTKVESDGSAGRSISR